MAVVHFETRLQKALDRVRVVLDANKAPCFASNIHHRYQDKYLLAECMTNTAVASQVNCLSVLGLDDNHLRQLCAWAAGSAVSLRFQSKETCKFERKVIRDVESPTKHVTEASVGGVLRAALTSKTVTTVTEFLWDFEVSYEMLAVRGIGQVPSDKMPVFARTGHVELKTTTETPPHPQVRVAATSEVNISWLLKQLDARTLQPLFKVDRAHAKCHTPSNNVDIEQARQHFDRFKEWAVVVTQYFKKLLNIQPDPSLRLDLGALDREAVFVPVLPLLEDIAQAVDASSATALEPGEETSVAAPTTAPTANVAATAAACAAQPAEVMLACLPSTDDDSDTLVLKVADTNRLLGEEARQLRERHKALAESFPTSNAVATLPEAARALTLSHCVEVCGQWAQAVAYIEGMLRKQLIAAIGKEVTPADFAEYMRFHNRKLFADAYAPMPFCFAVRRSSHHSPEGTVSVEEEVVGGGGDSNVAAPIVTIVAHSAPQHPMHFRLNASTNVSFGGDRYLHAWLCHKFSGQSGTKLSLVSRARQFSSMLVLVGRIASARSFEPKYAAIIQNKDELSIPLDLSTIPTPKEFKDAIESLSPEQQAFAKAFRSMQLESTLFGILIIQIKPQLEKVLNLPEDCLTKEIKLTQDLMQLFIKYQIPSDLLSYDATVDGAARVGEEDGVEIVGGATPSERLEAVRAHVLAMQQMIEQAKKEEVEERRMEAQYQQPVAMPQVVQEYRVCESKSFSESKSLRSRRTSSAAAPEAMLCSMPAMSLCAAPQRAAYQSVSAAAPAAPTATPATATAAVTGPAQQPQTQLQHPQHPQQAEHSTDVQGRDYTRVPTELDARFERLASGSALRPTIISPGEVWTKRAQKALLAPPTLCTLVGDDQKKEKDAAFDLLDALTKSGALAVEHASLHVLVAATHCFDRTVTETVVRDNINPIDKVEQSTLIMAGTVHQQPAAALVREAQLPRLSATCPALFLEDQEG